ncbi:MAG: ABC transporter permease [Anaerolineaceae bacterium]|nr:ABC transporter permease [Anaerolineaceae bacterium]
MKILAITLKDLRHSFRSVFGLMFMFGIPLLLSGVFYFAFSGMGQSDEGETVVERSPVYAALVNADNGEMGKQLVDLLAADELSEMANLSLVNTKTQALELLENHQVGAVVVIPASFSEQAAVADGQASVQLYARNIAENDVVVVQNLLDSMLDTLAIQQGLTVLLQEGILPPANVQSIFEAPQITSLLETNLGKEAVMENIMVSIVANIMGAMMIFFAFFSGAFGAQSILTEEAEGTLQRLFTTGNARQNILAGKFLAVWLSVVVQVATLLIVSGLIFKIEWGSLLGQLLLAIGIGTAAAGFGIFLLSFLRSMRSAGLVFSGAVMVSGFVGLGAVFTGSGEISNSALFVPQGWALKGLLALQAADVRSWLISAAVLMAWGLGLIFLGKIRFDHRYTREV